jgi:hypothetical protein
MTLARFQYLLKKINPNLIVRHRGVGDIEGVFKGRSGKGGYIVRMSKGELNIHGFRYKMQDPDNPMLMVNGPIKKRGRKTVINQLRRYGWVTNHRQQTMLMYGIDYPEDKIATTRQGRDQYGPKT